MARSNQSNIKQFRGNNLTDFSLFLGGVNVKNAALSQWDPLRTGYTRIFITKLPVFMETMFPALSKNFRHILEYGFMKVEGLGNIQAEFDQVTGGYNGEGFDVMTNVKDDTNEITITVLEFSGSPVREYLELWISGVMDIKAGIGHYHGAIDKSVPYQQANHTMEMFIVNTGPTGRSEDIEHCDFIANMMPKNIKLDQFNYNSGEHPIVSVDIPFTAVRYKSWQINEVGKRLLMSFKSLRNYNDFQSGYTYKDSGGGKTEIRDSDGIQITRPTQKDWVNISNV